MTKLTIINDTHLGVTRTAGTTKESQERLTRAMLTSTTCWKLPKVQTS